MGYLTGAPYLGPGGCRTAFISLSQQNKNILTKVLLPAADQKQPQFYTLYDTESWLNYWEICVPVLFLSKTNFLEAILSKIIKQPSPSGLGDSNFASID